MSDNLPEKRPASALVDQMSASFGRLLPSHLREDGGQQWIASVKAVLSTRPEIREAAENNLNAFMAALIQASRKGLEPGTDEFYLVPFAPKKGAPRIIQGIEGYKGIVERIYRAGAVSSVIVEVVKRNDKFRYRPGIDERPVHEVDWFGARGDLIGAYAYAIMADGGTSKVVVIGPDEIARVKAKSASAHSDKSPWSTDPESMWAKTAARQLQKWVPTSSEYRRQKLRDAQAVAAEEHSSLLAEALSMPDHLLAAADAADEADEYIDQDTGEVLGDVVDGEIVEDRGEEPVSGRADGGEAAARPETTTAVGVGGGPAPTTPSKPGAGRVATVSGASSSTAPDGDRPDAADPAAADAPMTASQSGGEEDAPTGNGESVAGGQASSSNPVLITSTQKQQLRVEAARLGMQGDTRTKLDAYARLLGLGDVHLMSVDKLTSDQADQLLSALRIFTTKSDLETHLAGQTLLGN